MVEPLPHVEISFAHALRSLCHRPRRGLRRKIQLTDASQPENQPPVADPLAEDMARFCARTDTAAPPSEWGPAAYAEAKTDELRGALDEVKQGGALPAARSRLEELASKAGVGECAAVATWPKA